MEFYDEANCCDPLPDHVPDTAPEPAPLPAFEPPESAPPVAEIFPEPVSPIASAPVDVDVPDVPDVAQYVADAPLTSGTLLDPSTVGGTPDLSAGGSVDGAPDPVGGAPESEPASDAWGADTSSWLTPQEPSAAAGGWGVDTDAWSESPLPTDAGTIDSGAASGTDAAVTNTGMSTLMDLIEAQGALSDVTISGNISRLDHSTGDVDGDTLRDDMDPNDITRNT